MPFLEIACFNADSALIAQEAGADRIELCDGISLGGTTPSFSVLQVVRSKTQIPVYVMIRPRGGNFVYSNAELDQIKCDMNTLRPLADGFVFGLLDNENGIDIIRNKELVELAGTLPCTFHRAFDAACDMRKALEDVISCGFKSILTSGGANNAVDGLGILSDLVDRTQGRVEIIPGGDIRTSNIEVLKKTRAVFFHSSALLPGEAMADAHEISSLKQKLKYNMRISIL